MHTAICFYIHNINFDTNFVNKLDILTLNMSEFSQPKNMPR